MDKKYIVNPSLVQAGLASAVRVITIMVTGFTALLGIFSRHDLSALYEYVQSSEGLTFITAIISAVTFGFSIWTKLRERKALAAAEPFTPNIILEAKK